MANATLSPTVNVCSVDSISPGQGRCFVIEGEKIAIFRQRNGRLFATLDACPHRQGPLSNGMVGNGRVVCPLHGRQFDLSCGSGIDHHDCIKTFPVSEHAGRIFLTRDVTEEAALQCA
jgi:nitrite reductase (NADH) small subunit